MRAQKGRIPTAALVLCNLLVYGGIIGTLVWNDWQDAKAESGEWRTLSVLSKEELYAEAFKFDATARPEMSSVFSAIVKDTDIYTRAEYAMDFPPFEEREWGVIYFAPDPAGYTQKVLDRLNEGIAASDKIVLSEPLSYPITVEDVIYNHEAVKALLDEFKKKDSENYKRAFSHAGN
ncbi:MAG: hypothetical protein LBP24_00610 [Coriobacteriales bacterium]|jgi:hypothetical protein|nr:hypothetical protein [Coriobacteriales bacterium]